MELNQIFFNHGNHHLLRSSIIKMGTVHTVTQPIFILKNQFENTELKHLTAFSLFANNSLKQYSHHRKVFSTRVTPAFVNQIEYLNGTNISVTQLSTIIKNANNGLPLSLVFEGHNLNRLISFMQGPLSTILYKYKYGYKTYTNGVQHDGFKLSSIVPEQNEDYSIVVSILNIKDVIPMLDTKHVDGTAITIHYVYEKDNTLNTIHFCNYVASKYRTNITDIDGVTIRNFKPIQIDADVNKILFIDTRLKSLMSSADKSSQLYRLTEEDKKEMKESPVINALTAGRCKIAYVKAQHGYVLVDIEYKDDLKEANDLVKRYNIMVKKGNKHKSINTLLKTPYFTLDENPEYPKEVEFDVSEVDVPFEADPEDTDEIKKSVSKNDEQLEDLVDSPSVDAPFKLPKVMAGTVTGRVELSKNHLIAETSSAGNSLIFTPYQPNIHDERKMSLSEMAEQIRMKRNDLMHHKQNKFSTFQTIRKVVRNHQAPEEDETIKQLNKKVNFPSPPSRTLAKQTKLYKKYKNDCNIRTNGGDICTTNLTTDHVVNTMSTSTNTSASNYGVSNYAAFVKALELDSN